MSKLLLILSMLLLILSAFCKHFAAFSYLVDLVFMPQVN